MRKRTSFAALWIALLFVALGALFLRKAGLHYDASFELAAFYACGAPVFKANVFGYEIPVMVLPYVGTLKTILYLPILEFLEVTVTAVRLPFLLIGATSVWLFFAILERVCGRRTAIIGGLLLASDVSFLVGTTYDFGPIALLHCFMLAGIWLLLRFETTGSFKLLAAAFFLFGLALWHKALFIWMLSGLSVATTVVFPGRVLALWSPRRMAVAIIALCAGAFPLIYYNVESGGGTFRPSEVISTNAPFAQKLLILRRTLDGSVLFGWLTEEANPESSVAPRRALQKASVRLSRGIGSSISNWMVYALAGAVLLLPWLWFTPARRAALFAFIYLGVTWALMIVLPKTGASLHHVILLWPFPHFLIAVAGAQIASSVGNRGAPMVAAAVGVLVASNLLVVNDLYADLLTRGTTVIWTDAVFPLVQYLESLPGKKVVAVEWGYSTTMCLLSDGDMPARYISGSLLESSAENDASIGSLIKQPNTVFVGYDSENEVMPGVQEHLASIADKAGYRKAVVAQIRDRNNRVRFDVFRYDLSGHSE